MPLLNETIKYEREASLNAGSDAIVECNVRLANNAVLDATPCRSTRIIQLIY